MLYNQPKIPLENCASCRGRACPARSLPAYPFHGSIRRGGIHPSRAPSRRRRRPRRPEGWPPYTPHIKPVRRAGCPHPAEAYRYIPFPHRRPVGAGHARPAVYRHILFAIQSVGEGFIPPGYLPPPQTAAAARGLAALHPHIKPVRRAGCPHPAETYRHIPFPHRRPVGAGHARPAAYRHILFTIRSVGEEFTPPGHPPAAANGRGGQRAGRPTPPHQTRA